MTREQLAEVMKRAFTGESAPHEAPSDAEILGLFAAVVRERHGREPTAGEIGQLFAVMYRVAEGVVRLTRKAQA